MNLSPNSRPQSKTGMVEAAISRGFLPVTFWSKIKKEAGGCWIWIGRRDKDGYGVFNAKRMPMRAHRVSFVYHGGSVSLLKPFVLHSCHNPSCVNPAHLRAGSHQENEDDKIAAGRQCRGSALHCGKLTESKVAIIKRLLASNTETKQAIADMFNVRRQSISKISKGITWKHI